MPPSVPVTTGDQEQRESKRPPTFDSGGDESRESHFFVFFSVAGRKSNLLRLVRTGTRKGKGKAQVKTNLSC